MAVTIKICGLTRIVDVQTAVNLGADYCGIIGYPLSPRYVAKKNWAPLLHHIPQGHRVWVSVEPTINEIESALSSGFDRAQIHFDPNGPWNPGGIAPRVEPHRLWLAPKLKCQKEFLPAWFSIAHTFLIDGFSSAGFGGTGKRVEPLLFNEIVKSDPNKDWILAGGINPENVRTVLSETGASWIDVNSGVEDSPGWKNSDKLKQLFENASMV